VRPAEPGDLEAVASQMAALAGDVPDPDRDTGVVRICIDDARLLAVAVRRLDDAGITVTDLALRQPSLDEVFLHLTGHRAQHQPAGSAETRPVPKRRTRRRAA
jgi:oleandomycin transport system ATP-binding protein